MQLVDSHCHLPLIDSGDDGMDGVVARAAAANVEHMLCVAVDLETFSRGRGSCQSLSKCLRFRRCSSEYRR